MYFQGLQRKMGSQLTGERRSSAKRMPERYFLAGPRLCLFLWPWKNLGWWGTNAVDYLNKLPLMSRDEHGRHNASDCKAHWRQLLSVQLQQCNACVILRKSSRVSGGQLVGKLDATFCALIVFKGLMGLFSMVYL